MTSRSITTQIKQTRIRKNGRDVSHFCVLRRSRDSGNKESFASFFFSLFHRALSSPSRTMSWQLGGTTRRNDFNAISKSRARNFDGSRIFGKVPGALVGDDEPRVVAKPTTLLAAKRTRFNRRNIWAESYLSCTPTFIFDDRTSSKIIFPDQSKILHQIHDLNYITHPNFEPVTSSLTITQAWE